MGRENFGAGSRSDKVTRADILRGVADIYGIESIYDKKDEEVLAFYDSVKELIDLGKKYDWFDKKKSRLEVLNETKQSDDIEQTPAERAKNETISMTTGIELAYNSEGSGKESKEPLQFIRNFFENYADYDDAAKNFDNIFNAVFRDYELDDDLEFHLDEGIESNDLTVRVTGTKEFTPEEYANTIGIVKDEENPNREKLVRKEIESKPKTKEGKIIVNDWEEDSKVNIRVGNSVDKFEEIELGDVCKGLELRKEKIHETNLLFNKDGLKNIIDKLNSATIFSNSKSFNKIIEAYNEYNATFGDKSGTIGLMTKEQKEKLQNLVNACDNYLDTKDKQKGFTPNNKDDMPKFSKNSGAIRYSGIRDLSNMIKDTLGSNIAMTQRDRCFDDLALNINTKGVTQKENSVAKVKEKENVL